MPLDATELALEEARARARTAAMSTDAADSGTLTGDPVPEGIFIQGTAVSGCVRLVHLPDSLRGHDGSYELARFCMRGVVSDSLIYNGSRSDRHVKTLIRKYAQSVGAATTTIRNVHP